MLVVLNKTSLRFGVKTLVGIHCSVGPRLPRRQLRCGLAQTTRYTAGRCPSFSLLPSHQNRTTLLTHSLLLV